MPTTNAAADTLTVARTGTGHMLHYSTDGQTTVCGKDQAEVLAKAGEQLYGRPAWANCRKCDRQSAQLFRRYLP